MKKLMFTLAAVACAAGLQAATINWSSQKTVLCDETGTAIKALGTGQSVVMIALDAVTDDWKNGTWTAEKDSVTEYQTGTIATMGTTIGKVSQNYVFNLADKDAPVNGTILAMVFKDADGSYRQLEYFGGSALTETATVSGLSDDSKDFTANFGSATESKMMPASVPEPTSAMLLLLGIGAMALRRRRA